MAKTTPPGTAGAPPARLISAAGAVLWRSRRRGAVEVAVIHRPRYDDWSLPKGKVDPGETEPITAVREILEETGHRAELGRQLGAVTYPIQQGVKKVRYWAARSLGGEFLASSEVDDLVWLPVPEAMQLCGYTYDRKILRRFDNHPADSRTVLIVRHATAGSKSRFAGDDTQRPLDKRGRQQAESLVAQLLAFGAAEVHAADRLRCHQTVQPLATELGVPITDEPSLTEEAYAHNPKRARRRVLQIAESGRTPVICSQGRVIPDLIAWWCERDGVRPAKSGKSGNRKGSTWVLSLSGGRLVAADYIDSPLAAKPRVRQGR